MAVITNVTVIRDTALGARACKATWTWDKRSQTESFQTRWGYHTPSGGNYFEDSSVSVDSQWISVYNFPEGADKVWFHVKPVSKTYKTDKKTDTVYWTSDWSAGVAVPDLMVKPATPNVPTVEIKGNQLTATVRGIELDQGIYNHVIEFQVVKGDDQNAQLFDTGKFQAKYQAVTATFTVDLDEKYQVRCRLAKHPPEDSKYLNAVVYSDWTAFSEPLASGLTTPKWHYVESSVEKSVDAKWSLIKSATGYEIQYTTNEEYFDASDLVTTVTVGTNIDHYHITGLEYTTESQNTYFFRVRAVRDTAYSEWSDIFQLHVGEEPAAPTTWSLTSTGIVGDNLIFYWVHNARDNSKQTGVKIQFTVGNTTKEEEIEYTPQAYGDEKTYSYTLDTAGWTSGTKYSLDTRVPYNGKLYRCKKTHTASDSNKPGSDTTTWAKVTFDTGDSWFNLSAGATLKWRVKTRGALKGAEAMTGGSEGYSVWSVQREIVLYARPTLTLRVVNSSDTQISRVTGFPFYISAKPSGGSQEPIGYHISITANQDYEDLDAAGNTVLVRKGEEVYSKYFSYNDDLLIEMSAGNINLKNAVSYTVDCVVTMDSGLDATAEKTFSVSWSETVPEPNAGIGINEGDLSAYIQPICEQNGSLVSGITLSVYRIEADGNLVEIAKDVKNQRGFFVTDPHPTLNYARYRIVAKSTSTGAISFYDMPSYPVGEKAIIIQWNERWQNFDDNSIDALLDPPFSGSLLRLPYNINVSESNDTDVALIEYIGRSHPVSYYGTQLGSKATWSVDIDKKDTETIYALRRLARWVGDVYVREPSGTGYWANVKVSFSQTHLQLTIPVTLEIVRVEGGV